MTHRQAKMIGRAALTLSVLVAILVACGGPTTAAPTVPSVATSSPSAGTTPSATVFVFKVPDDIPILPDAVELRGTQSQGEYFSEMTIPDAVAYYQQEFVAQGWEALGQANIFGNVGGVTYGKDQKRATVHFQFNELSKRLLVSLNWSGY